MNIEEIDKWLDNEYGTSYTRLEELHDYFFEKYTDQKEEIKRLNNIIKTKDEGIKAFTEDLCEESIKIEKAIKKLNKYRNRKDTWGLWCMEYGDNAEVIKILGGEVRND